MVSGNYDNNQRLIVVLTNTGDNIAYRHGLHFLLGSVSHIELESKFNLIHEHEWTGNTVTAICKEYSVSRKR